MARSVQHRNIQDFLSAIKQCDSSHGYALNVTVFLHFQFILCGIKRFQGTDSKARRPITLHILNLFYRHLNAKYTPDKESLTVWAAMTLVFFGFLLIGELTCDSHLNPERHITVPDLMFMPKSSPKFKLVGLEVSKTDPFRKEQTILIEKANSNSCPISAMLIYLESHTPFPTSVPLFTFQSGFFLIWGRLTSEARLLLLKGGLDSSEFCCSQFSHRCSYDRHLKQCIPLARYVSGVIVLWRF